MRDLLGLAELSDRRFSFPAPPGPPGPSPKGGGENLFTHESPLPRGEAGAERRAYARRRPADERRASRLRPRRRVRGLTCHCVTRDSVSSGTADACATPGLRSAWQPAKHPRGEQDGKTKPME